ncbi:MAG TPA: prepilin-type N-terminal cleavage/methylation domain-containing protein [Candidatus Binatia bacterium]|nr:prepilin-type N-terminal cleavage/methylation domain-containing protein [Candidatus Binatia bacterium]
MIWAPPSEWSLKRRKRRAPAGNAACGRAVPTDSTASFHPNVSPFAKTLTGNMTNTRPVHSSFASAFTLLELLVVISILGILAALSVPAIKNLGKSNAQVGAAQQLVDDVSQARRFAISRHTTVYMIFLPENFWLPGGSSTWFNSLDYDQKAAVTNLLDKQFTGYAFMSLRSVGDQPGQPTSQYIGEWKSLPEGSFIATNKFNLNFYPSNPNNYYPITDNSQIPNLTYRIYSLNYTNGFPFPTETNSAPASLYLPYIAFNYLGQLTVDGNEIAPRDEYIPLAQGSILYAKDANKALQLAPPDVLEQPPGNSTNSMFNIVHIDRLTGRAELLKEQVQ